ncbi:MAG: type I-C CRISPR-associated protein Cas5 [Burkholderiaceae bacterium]|jgi:CRISPR-associated protein Cas5d|nr:type I-C CRISPR-associated protein Cas5 [Burkholderiaceae bacterium]MEB2352994.1 type I-C CRISPR-associated protein Cas5c [Burkholderiaceae bacterium]
MKRYCLEIAGEFACFTRPEMKVERVSYDVITPSAARAVFEAILWKPAIRWHVRRIEVLNPVRWINLRRNEVASVISTRNVQEAMSAGRGDLALYVEDDRQQRAGLFLRDVAYRLHADLEVRDDRDDPPPPQKYFAMFERRAKSGQCVNQPYLGCREFAARMRLVENLTREPLPVSDTRDLGWMLYDLDFSDRNDPKPIFFRARMTAGVIDVDAAEVAR